MLNFISLQQLLLKRVAPISEILHTSTTLLALILNLLCPHEVVLIELVSSKQEIRHYVLSFCNSWLFLAFLISRCMFCLSFLGFLFWILILISSFNFAISGSGYSLFRSLGSAKWSEEIYVSFLTFSTFKSLLSHTWKQRLHLMVLSFFFCFCNCVMLSSMLPGLRNLIF